MLRAIEYAWPPFGSLLVACAVIWLAAALLSRTRRGELTQTRAALFFLSTACLPIVFSVVLFLIASLANDFGDSSIWNGDGFLGPFMLFGMLLATVVAANASFWVALLFVGKPRSRNPERGRQGQLVHATKLGVMSGLVVYAIRLLFACVGLNAAGKEPEFLGGIIPSVGVWLLPWFALSAVVSATVFWYRGTVTPN